MSELRFAALAAEVDAELAELRALGDEFSRLRTRIAPRPTRWTCARPGSILNDFYSGLERIFERIATELDGGAPTGADWYTTLLRRAALPIESVRPAVVSSDTQTRLEEYLRFRHLFRNVCGGQLRWARMEPLVDDLPNALRTVADERSHFTA